MVQHRVRRDSVNPVAATPQDLDIKVVLARAVTLARTGVRLKRLGRSKGTGEVYVVALPTWMPNRDGKRPSPDPLRVRMRLRAWAAVGLASATAVAVFGVGQNHTSGNQGSAQGQPSATASRAQMPLTVVDEDTGQTVSPTVVPRWDAASRGSAARAGSAVVARFARPVRGDGRQWWAALEPLLTPRARVDFASVDPRNVPLTAVTGRAHLVDESSAYVAKVMVPTDAGAYLVVLSRTGAGAAWLADDLVPPDRQR